LVLVALILTTLCAQAVLVPKMDVDSLLRKRFTAQKMSEQDQDKAMAVVGKMKWVQPIAVIVAFPLTLAMFAGIYFLGMKLLGSESNDFVRVFSGMAHAFWPPTIVKTVLVVAVAFNRSKIDVMEAGHLVKSNLGAFLPTDTPRALIALGDCVDVFDLWRLFLVTLAVSIIGRLPLAKAFAIAGSIWVVTCLLYVGAATVQSLAQN